MVLEQILKNYNKKYEKNSSVLKYIFVDVCKIDQSKYYLLGSFVLREHRKINDLDINLDKDEFMKDPKVDYSNNNFSLSKLKTKKGLTYDNNGHHFFNVTIIIKMEKPMNRAKDQKDIQLIKSLYKLSL